MSNPWRELSRLPRAVWILSLSTLLNRMGTMALPFLTLYLTRSLGLSASRAGALLALYGMVSLVVGPLAGRLCDRWTPLRVMRVSLVLAAAAMSVYPSARDFTQAALLTVLWSAAAEAFRPAALTCIAEYSPPALRKQAYALHRLAINLGMSVGPALGGFLATVSFPAIFLVDAASALLGAVVLLAGLSAAPAVSEPEEAAAPSARALSDRRLVYALLALIPVATVFFQHESSMPLFLVRDLGLPESVYGLLFTLNTVMIVALEIPLNHWTRHWPYRRTLALGSLLYAAGFGSLAWVSGGWGAAATVAVWTFGEMILFPGLSAYVSEIAPARRRGEYMGLLMMAFSVAFIAGTWGGVLAFDRLGGTALWGACFVLGTASALLYARL